MFARVLTLHVRLEKKPELATKILNDVLPMIKRSVGPVEIFTLQDEVDVDRLLVISMWRTREDAERYHKTYFEKVRTLLEPYLTFPPALRTYTVDERSPLNLLARELETVPAPKASLFKIPQWS